jgi:Family of unknown function (DUF6510)
MMENGSEIMLDGNAAAGPLQELFVPEITVAQIQCRACDSMAAIGALHLYAAPMGIVLRCPHCESIAMRSVHTPRGRWLEMTGARFLKF